MRKSAGFSMIELIVVVIVIGVLATLAIPNYINSMERANCAEALNTVEKMRKAAIIYYREHQTFTGIGQVVLGDLVGANFADTNKWDYDAISTSANTFSISARRLNGRFYGTAIIVTETGDFTLSSYPYENPGVD